MLKALGVPWQQLRSVGNGSRVAVSRAFWHAGSLGQLGLGVLYFNTFFGSGFLL